MELVFVHLTDIHIKGEEDLSVLTPRADNIGRVICSHITVPDNSKVIFIFTGDFVFSGKEDEYIVAGLFIEEILDVLRNRHTNVSYHLVFVPGNHDCDFDDPSNGLRKALLESNRLDIKDSIQLQHCTSVQNNFFAFASQMKALSCESDRIITVKEIQLDNIDLKLMFHCINTSWCSEINEKKGNMKFGIDILPERNQNDILFTLMHHDAEWLNWEDKEKWEKYHKTFSDFIFVGHDHSVEFTIKKNYDDSTRYYIRGNQLYDNSNPDQSGFNILKINTDTMQECFITYEWQSNMYKKIINTGYRAFEKNQYSIGGVQLKKNTRSYLEDLDVDIKYNLPNQ